MSLPDDRPVRAHSEKDGSGKPSKTVSERKRAANRANSRKSTGPKTPEGKIRVSLNALTHGLTAAAAVLPFENQDHFEKFAAVVRAELKPRGFVQQLMVERLVDVAWKQRRAVKAISEHAARRLEKHLGEFELAREEGAWVGPDFPLTGTEMLVDSAEGEAEAAAFLRLELYADRLQRSFQVGLNHLRREQKRQAEAGEEVGAPAEEAAAGVEVELEDDPIENARFENKATRARRAEEEPVNLMRYWVEPSKRVPLSKLRERLKADEQNKATAGAEETSGDAPEVVESREPASAPREPDAASSLSPSPGTPGEGGGEGSASEISDLESELKKPSPQPSPGVPGEGEMPSTAPPGQHVDLQSWHDLPPWDPRYSAPGRIGG